MALSDCSECWDTPCTCGKHWKNTDNDYIVKYILSVVKKKSRQDALLILNSALDLKYQE